VSAVPGFTMMPFSHAGVSRDVYRRGAGPAVVVMSELPGITPPVAGYATRVADAGFAVHLPNLVGTPMRPMSPGYLLASTARICISRQWRVLAANRSSPVVDWLRALARRAHIECGGPGVGAVGLCLTGNFALAMMLDAPVLAAVLAEPALPFTVLPRLRAGLHASPAEIAAAHDKIDNAGARLLGLRFQTDPMCPKERFAQLRREFDSAFEGIELPDDAANPAARGPAHSVLTDHLIDEDGQPTRAALDRTLAFLHQQLTR
jgi:dienelactone hydrolase